MTLQEFESHIPNIKQFSKPRVYCTLPDGSKLSTTHWWVRGVGTRKIYDLTKSQFMYGVNVEEFYKKPIKADVGYPYFSLGPKKSELYGENVPTRIVLKLGKLYRDKYGSAGGLDFWLDEFIKLGGNI